MAYYSEAAQTAFPFGRATALRGQTDVSPIGTFIRQCTQNTAVYYPYYSQQWQSVDFGSEMNNGFVVGNPESGIGSKFVIGFVKSAQTSTRPLADFVTARGYTYTWFGGPWNASLPHPWGSYSSNSLNILDIAAQCLVSYPWGYPIIIQNPLQLSNTYAQSGPWQFTVNLYSDTTITANDTIQLKWTSNGTSPIHSVNLTAIEGQPDLYGCAITSSSSIPVDGVVQYWVECTDRLGRRSTSQEFAQQFSVVAPVISNANLLIVTDSTDVFNDGDRFGIIATALDSIHGISYEQWDIQVNKGIDQSVIMHGWNNIMYFGNGNTSKNGGVIPAIGEPTSNPWVTFCNAGHNLMVVDQDYFSGAGITESTHTFVEGDFAYDKFGVATCQINPLTLQDSTMWGVTDDPITGSFSNELYQTNVERLFYYTNQYSPSRHNWFDPITVADGNVLFSGSVNEAVFGTRKVVGTSKNILFTFMLDAAATEDTSDQYNPFYLPTTQFTQVIRNVLGWWNLVSVSETSSPLPQVFALHQNYPNPFNPTTTITYSLPKPGTAKLSVFDITGRNVTTLVNSFQSAGTHNISFDAARFSSGVYYYQLVSGKNTLTRKMVYVK